MTTAAELNTLAESYLGSPPGTVRANCPLCDGRDDVSITVETDGHVVVHCHHCDENGAARVPRPNGAARRSGAHRTPSARARRAAPDFAAMWNSAPHAPEDHPYLLRKRVKPYNLRLDGDDLLLAVRNVDGAITGLQTIAPDGEKKFAPRTKKTGAYFSIGRPGDRIIVCEGYATGATIHEATRDAVAVAFDCGNLAPATKALRAKYPNQELVLAADDDAGRDDNPGMAAATAAARAVGARVAVPAWPHGLERGNGTDFNDLFVAAGADAVRACFAVALATTVSAPPTANWEAGLLRKRATRMTPERIIDCEFNAAVILDNAAPFAAVHFDTFLKRERDGVSDLTDHHENKALLYLQRSYAQREDGCVFEARHAKAGLRAVANSSARRRDVLQAFIESLPVWDGTRRCETFWIRAVGATDNDFTRAAGRNFFRALVARALRPACKLDECFVLVGAEGIGKSSALEMIGGEFFGDVAQKIGSDDFRRALRGKWLVELAELTAFHGRDTEHVKQALTDRYDRMTEKYQTRSEDHPRRVVIAGSTNEQAFLNTPGGDRRFVPIACTLIDFHVIETERLQLLAEARADLDAGQVWHDYPFESAIEVRESRRLSDGMEDQIAEFMRRGRQVVTGYQFGEPVHVDERLPTDFIPGRVLLDWLDVPAERRTSAMGRRLATVMKALRWEPHRPRDGVLRDVRGFRPKASDDAEQPDD